MTNENQRTTPSIPGYEIIRLIGLGGMGEVHLANQLSLNRRVAIKFLTRTTADPPGEYDERFRREAELMARVSHPNVVTIFDFGTAGSRPYLVMEYVEAGDLRSRMVPDSPMEIGEIRKIIRPVIRAMEYLHSRGIIHRDMKPENILIHLEETPKVTDFGIAVLDFAFGSLTRTGQSMGTPGYVAPEQQYGLKVDERADQFSLAALCYELATGRKPLGAFPPPAKLNPKLGPEASEVILKALSEDSADRFATIGDFGEALDRGLASVEGQKSSGPRAGLFAGIAIAACLVGVALVALAGPFFGKRPKVLQPAVVPGEERRPDVPQPEVVPRGDSRIVAKSVDMTLVKIPSGEFWMGSPLSDTDALPMEFPRHPVRITRPFYLGEKEVTVGQFKAFVAATGHETTAETNKAGGWIFNMKSGAREQRSELNWRHPGYGKVQLESEPVVQVSWKDAVAFCEWLTRVEGRLFRLPTEAEWEYACRAGTSTRWSSGDSPESLMPYAWTLKNAGDTFHPVGTKAPNPFGLYDMHGNVWEWCADWLCPYAEAAVADPMGPASGKSRVIRGGSIDWGKVEYTRSAVRLSYEPDRSYFNYGFRVCSPILP